jgi:hypothetical protein
VNRRDCIGAGCSAFVPGRVPRDGGAGSVQASRTVGSALALERHGKTPDEFSSQGCLVVGNIGIHRFKHGSHERTGLACQYLLIRKYRLGFCRWKSAGPNSNRTTNLIIIA